VALIGIDASDIDTGPSGGPFSVSVLKVIVLVKFPF